MPEVNTVKHSNDQNDLEWHARTDLIDPVRVEDPKASKLASCTLLGDGSQITLELQLRNTLVLRLSIYNTLGNRPLSASTAHTDTVDHVSLNTSRADSHHLMHGNNNKNFALKRRPRITEKITLKATLSQP